MTPTSDRGWPRTVLSIDPGTVKCGLAIVAGAESESGGAAVRIVHREVVGTERLVARVLVLLSDFPEVGCLIIGNATRGASLRRALQAALPADMPLHSVDEAFTSQRARVRFQIENPPRGWQRLVPPGLRSPPRPYDDYVAVLLAEDWFAATGKTTPESAPD